MTMERQRRPVPAIMLKPDEAASAMGVSRNYFDANILPQIPHVRRGAKIILIPVRELEKWAEANAA